MNRRLSDWRIRDGTAEDLGAVLELWSSSGAEPTVTDAIEPLRALLDADPGALLLADSDGAVIGSLIAAWNGWRGSFYRLTVHPDRRRDGLATALVREGERRLRELGAARVDAIVDAHEPAAVGFWSAFGYERQVSRTRFVRNFDTGR